MPSHVGKFFAGFGQFIADAQWYGMSSEAAGVTGVVVALYEHSKNPLSAWGILIVSVVLVFIGTFVAWKKEFEDAERLRLAEKQKPRIMQKKNSFRCEARNLGEKGICSLVVDFENNLEVLVETANARQVYAKVKFFRIDGQPQPTYLFEDYARWASNPEVSQLQPNQTLRDIRATDIKVGDLVQLDIAVRFVWEADCFAVTDESAFYELRKPDRKLPPCQHP